MWGRVMQSIQLLLQQFPRPAWYYSLPFGVLPECVTLTLRGADRICKGPILLSEALAGMCWFLLQLLANNNRMIFMRFFHWPFGSL